MNHSLLSRTGFVVVAAAACSSPHQLGLIEENAGASAGATASLGAGAGGKQASMQTVGGVGGTTASNGGSSLPGGGAGVPNSPSGGTTTGGTSSGGTGTTTGEAGTPTFGGAGFQGGQGGDGGATLQPQAGFAGVPTLDEICTLPPVKLQFTVDVPGASCRESASWTSIVEIRDSSGALVKALNDWPSSMVADLQSIELARCPECRQLSQLTDGLRFEPMTTVGVTWPGDRDEVLTCPTSTGSGKCGIRHCMLPGRYQAHFCLKESLSCDFLSPGAYSALKATPDTCVDVWFDFPTTETVNGVVKTTLRGVAGAAGVGNIPASGGTAGGGSLITSLGSAGTTLL